MSSGLGANDNASTEFGSHTVHHSVFPSMFILPDIAKIHSITRAEDRILINISVHKTADNQAVSAEVSGTATNLMQQMKTLDFKTISEADATYYIASLRTSNREVYHFDIAIKPPGQTQAFHLKFAKKLYTEKG